MLQHFKPLRGRAQRLGVQQRRVGVRDLGVEDAQGQGPVAVLKRLKVVLHLLGRTVDLGIYKPDNDDGGRDGEHEGSEPDGDCLDYR